MVSLPFCVSRSHVSLVVASYCLVYWILGDVLEIMSYEPLAAPSDHLVWKAGKGDPGSCVSTAHAFLGKVRPPMFFTCPASYHVGRPLVRGDEKNRCNTDFMLHLPFLFPSYSLL